MSDIAFELVLKREFLLESEEIIHAFELGLLKLEADPSIGPVVNDMFRYAHTLKGSALAAGFDSYGNFARKMENLLDLIRAKKIELSKEVVQTLLQSIDLLKDFSKRLKDDFEAVVDSRVLENKIECLISNNNLTKDQKRTDTPQKQTSQTAGFTDFSAKPGFVVEEAHKPIVYVCEDDLFVKEAILDSMPKAWVVEGFDEAKTLLSRATEVRPNLIISDLNLGGMSGIDAVRELRKSIPKTPVIFISGCADRENIVEFVKLGVFDFLEKPFNYSDLIRSAAHALKSQIHDQTLEEISILAFRSYMNFSNIDSILDPAKLTKEERLKVRDIEFDMTKIGALCTRASRFAKNIL